MARLFFLAVLMVLVGFFVAFSTAAFADRRVALVVGNSQYKATNEALANPRNDAQDVAAVLASLGFEVIAETDANKRAFDAALVRFARSATTADSALFFYAGHAMQYQGRNYLMPVDAELEDEVSLRYSMIAMDDVRSALDRSNGVRIMILDACRNNPLADNFLRTVVGQTRSVEGIRGLARVDKTQGMVVAYATAPDDVALDGTGRNSPFTSALLKRMQEPGLEIAIMFRRITSDVNIQTGGRQRPETYISLLSEYYLNQNDRLAWEKIRDSGDVGSMRDFITRFPTSVLARNAQHRIDVLERAARERQEKDVLASIKEQAELEAAKRHEIEERLAKLEAERLNTQRLEAEQEASRQRAEQERQAKVEADRQKAAAEAEERLAAQRRAEQERLAKLEEERQKAAAEVAALEEAKRRFEAAEQAAKAEAEKQAVARAMAEREAARHKEAAEQAAKVEAEKQAARIAAEREAARQKKAAEAEAERQAARIAAERETARQKEAAEQQAKTEAEKRAAQVATEREAARQKEAEEQQAKAEAEKRAAQVAAEREAARQKEAEEQQAKAEAEKRAAQEAAEREAARQKEAAEQQAKAEAEKRSAREAAEREAARQKEAAEKLAKIEEEKRHAAREAAEQEAARQHEIAEREKAARVCQDEYTKLQSIWDFDVANLQTFAERTPCEDARAMAQARIAGHQAQQLSAEQTCKREEEKLALLQSAGATDQLRIFEKELSCERLRPIIQAALSPPAARIDAVPEDTRELIRNAQRQLRRIGCFDGEDDGNLNAATVRALKEYLARRGQPTDEPKITPTMLSKIKAETNRVCPLVCPPGKSASGERCIAERHHEEVPEHPRARHEKRQHELEARRPSQAPRREREARRPPAPRHERAAVPSPAREPARAESRPAAIPSAHAIGVGF
jgi:hypothetical protein